MGLGIDTNLGILLGHLNRCPDFLLGIYILVYTEI